MCDSTERFRATAKKCEENRAAGVMLDDSIEIIKVIRGWGLPMVSWLALESSSLHRIAGPWNDPLS